MPLLNLLIGDLTAYRVVRAFLIILAQVDVYKRQELATIGKDMVVYALDGRKGDGAILSKDKAVRGRGVEPLDYGSACLLYTSLVPNMA